MNTPLIIQCAITGSQDPNGRKPALPTTPARIAESALEAWQAGAAMVHLHARLEDGTPTQRVDVFREIVERIRTHPDCDVILNLSTGSAGGRATGAERYACIELEPEVASFDCGTLNFGERIFDNPLPFLREMAAAFAERGVKPEIECFEAGHIATALGLRDEGLLSDPLHFQFVLGVPGGAPGSIEHAVFMRSMIGPEATWSVCGVGRDQLPLNLYSLASGGHARTGLEDTLYFRRGEPAASNAQLVSRLVRLAEEVGRPIATPPEARSILGLRTFAA